MNDEKTEEFIIEDSPIGKISENQLNEEETKEAPTAYFGKLEKERIDSILATPLSELKEKNDAIPAEPSISSINKRPAVNMRAKRIKYTDSEGKIRVIDQKENLQILLTGKSNADLERENLNETDEEANRKKFEENKSLMDSLEFE